MNDLPRERLYSLKELTEALLKRDLDVELILNTDKPVAGMTVYPVHFGGIKYWRRDWVHEWLDAYSKVQKETTEEKGLIIPWSFAVVLLQIHLTSKLFKKGYTVEQAQEMIQAAKVGKPSDEMFKVTQEVLDEAGHEYQRREEKSSGVGLHRKGSRRK